jgi:hypothetical protein
MSGDSSALNTTIISSALHLSRGCGREPTTGAAASAHLKETGMGQMSDSMIEAFQEAAGIEPATGERLRILNEMSNAAFELIKIIELAKSGIRDGNGFWHGSDPLGGTVSEICNLDRQYGGTWTRSSSSTADDEIPW